MDPIFFANTVKKKGGGLILHSGIVDGSAFIYWSLDYCSLSLLTVWGFILVLLLCSLTLQENRQ